MILKQWIKDKIQNFTTSENEILSMSPGKHIFDNVLGRNGLLKNKTRILVTNSITILPDVDQIFVLKDGSVSESGTYKELLSNGGVFAEFLMEHIQQQQVFIIFDLL